ncbi:M-phase-specific PLK1-interacting protein [Wyeomyia smithii]|uniref:M-phase-specific PLK1-interacting protein n=1 Tax=Wyeomyia smithii TaxID=174621 RepID=UPI0024681DAD|nr:M-phase-specific PLK1-interacting protein [Wyeomyia smithii]
MSSSPGDHRHPFESPENKDSAPLYHSTDGFIPLGFSTPQHRNTAQNDNLGRNYYSTQPKYMLPRQRGPRNRGNFQQQPPGGAGPPEKSSPGGEDGCSFAHHPEQHRNFKQRNWKGQDYQRNRHPQQQRRNRSGFGHQARDNYRNDIKDYFHPSMLEDPWAHLEQKPQPDKASCDSSDGGEGEAASSDVGEE